MLGTDEILDFIQQDRAGEQKRFAETGQRYYEAEHDIRNYKLYYYDSDGVLQEDKTRSNIKISHPFFTELVDQEVQYMLSGEGFVKSKDDQLQAELEQYFGDDFKSELEETLTSTVASGFSYMYAYKGADDRTRFMFADTMGVVEVRAKDAEDGQDHVIYWYVERMSKTNQLVRRIQDWDKEQTYYYVQEGDGKLEKDPDVPLNPRPHILYKKEGDDSTYYDAFHFVPFFRLDNNRRRQSGLRPVKPLIDDYDLMSCGLSNNIQDVGEALYVVSGFQGDNLDELIQNVKVKKHIGVDVGGTVDIKTVAIPTEARVAKLELDEKNIYRFGMGFNAAMVGDGNVTNVVIRSRYALLDLKCNKLEIRLKQFLRKLVKVALDEINKANGTDYRQKDVQIEFGREIMTNAVDNATIEKTEADTAQVKVTTLLNAASALDEDTVVKGVCDILDLDYQDVKDKRIPAPEDGLANAQAAIGAVQPAKTPPAAPEGVTGT